MSIDKIFNNSTILKGCIIYVDDVEIIVDDIIAFKFNHSLYELGMTGSIKFTDSFDIANKLVNFNGTNKIKFRITDFLGTDFNKEFVIIGVMDTGVGERFKTIDLFFRDEISYKLSNTYLSKSFTDTPINSFKKYLTHLGIDDIIKSTNLAYDIVDTSTSDTFVVPQNISVLEYFTEIFNSENIRIWLDRNQLHIKELIPSELTPLTYQNSKVVYTNNTLNNDYVFKIHEYKMDKFMVQNLNQNRPIQRNFRYEFNKEIIDDTKNLKDVFADLKLNDLDVSDLQQTIGEQYNSQVAYATKLHEFSLAETYLNNNIISIVIPGNFENTNVGSVVEIDLRGNIGFEESQLNGDVVNNGKYIITNTQDLLAGSKYTSKLTLKRLDTQAPK